MSQPSIIRFERAERRAAPKPARVPSGGDRPRYTADEGQS